MAIISQGSSWLPHWIWKDGRLETHIHYRTPSLADPRTGRWGAIGGCTDATEEMIAMGAEDLTPEQRASLEGTGYMPTPKDTPSQAVILSYRRRQDRVVELDGDPYPEILTAMTASNPTRLDGDIPPPDRAYFIYWDGDASKPRTAHLLKFPVQVTEPPTPHHGEPLCLRRVHHPDPAVRMWCLYFRPWRLGIFLQQQPPRPAPREERPKPEAPPAAADRRNQPTPEAGTPEAGTPVAGTPVAGTPEPGERAAPRRARPAGSWRSTRRRPEALPRPTFQTMPLQDHVQEIMPPESWQRPCDT